MAVARDDAGAMGVLAEGLLAAGRPEEAWPVASRAARLAPWSSQILGTCADVALALGRCEQAVAFGARAVEVLPDAVPPGAAPRTRAEERARGAANGCAARAGR